MKVKRNVLAVLAFFLLLVLLAKAAEDESEVINENSETADLNDVNVGNNIKNSITQENIQETPIENIKNQEHHAAATSFGVYLNIVG